MDYPASKATLLSTAEDDGAPEEFIEMIEGLPLGEFSDPEEFMNHLRAVPNSIIDRSQRMPRVEGRPASRVIRRTQRFCAESYACRPDASSPATRLPPRATSDAHPRNDLPSAILALRTGSSAAGTSRTSP